MKVGVARREASYSLASGAPATRWWPLPRTVPRMRTDHSCGVIPVRLVKGKRQYLLVQHSAGHWSFPKGHPEGDETPRQTAERELLEETGYTCAALAESPAFEEQYAFTKRSGTQVLKSVIYFVGRVKGDGKPKLQASEVSDAAWGDAASTAKRMTFDEGRALLVEVERHIETLPVW